MSWLIAAFLNLVALLIHFHPNERKARKYKAELLVRKCVSDDELYSRFFATRDIPPEVPGQVRRVFAEYMGYPADRMLADDDLSFFWHELDMADLFEELESCFGIEITAADTSLMPSCTIRGAADLVARKLAKPA